MLSEEQARAILDLRLQRLTALGRDEIADELNKIGAEIKRLSSRSCHRAPHPGPSSRTN
jgi:DNA gyrase/topoisomerase IV subunit A